MSWTIERSSGPAGPFHQRSFDDVDRPTAWIHRVLAPALVLGSTTDEALVRRDRAAELGVEVCRRRSGGGLVLVEPEHSCWIDLVLPRSHALWDDDVNRSFSWVGEAWANALTSLGVTNVTVYDGPLTDRELSRALCFAGLGPGEVTVPTGDGLLAKVVGLSQRRTKTAARFQGLFVSNWSPDRLLDLIDPTNLPNGLDVTELAISLSAALPHSASGGIDSFAVEEAFLDQLV